MPSVVLREHVGTHCIDKADANPRLGIIMSFCCLPIPLRMLYEIVKTMLYRFSMKWSSMRSEISATAKKRKKNSNRVSLLGRFL